MIFSSLYIAIAIVIIVVLTAIGLMSRYRKCPSNQILIVFGKAGKDKDGNAIPSKIIHGGGTFVWPVIQDYQYLSTLPIQISTTAQDILSQQNINVSFPVNLTVAIDTSSEAHKQAAASHLLGLPMENLKRLLTNNLLGGLRAVVATLQIEELNKDRDAFLEAASKAIKPSLDELGLKIIDLNMEDLSDNDHYLENLSKKAVTKAESEAKADIAEMKKIGDIKEAAANKEREITVGQTKQEQEIQLAEIERLKAEKKAEIAKNQATAVANQNAEQRAKVAQAEATAAIAEETANADAASKTAEKKYAAQAAIAQSNAEAESKKAEAEASKLQRIAEAKAKQEAAAEKAQQEKDAQVAEFEANKKKRQALANQEAQVAAQQANAEIAKAEGAAEKTRQEAKQTAGLAQVQAEMEVAKQKQERQLQVNEAEAKATAARLNAEQVVPAEAAKKAAEVRAEQEKQIRILQAQADAETKKTIAAGQAQATRDIAYAEASAIEMKGESEAAAIKAKLEAQYNAEVAKAEGMSKAEVAGILQLANDLGDPQAAVQYFMRDVTKETKVAEAQSQILHDVFGQVTVYGDSQTAGNMASNLLNLVPQIKQMGHAVSEGIQTVKDAWKGPIEIPSKEKKSSETKDVNSLGEQEFGDPE